MRKIISTLLVIVMSLVIISEIMPVHSAKAASFSRPDSWQYDTKIWDKTEYEKVSIFYKVEVKLEEEWDSQKGKLLGLVYFYPTFFQANKRIDGYIYQAVAFLIKSTPQVFFVGDARYPEDLDKYTGMTQYISVTMNNVHDDSQMMCKSIGPAVLLESTVMNKKYITSIGKEWGLGGMVNYSAGNWTLSAQGSKVGKMEISTGTTYVSSALSVSTIDHVESSGSAVWRYDYIQGATFDDPKCDYLASTTWQTGVMSWRGPKDANYYFSNFVFNIKADFGLARINPNDRGICAWKRIFQEPCYVFGSESIDTPALGPYKVKTDFAK